jgi:hypothetical protein
MIKMFAVYISALLILQELQQEQEEPMLYFV